MFIYLNHKRLKAKRLSKLDTRVLSLLSDDIFLAGGALRTLVDQEEKILDYDMFFRNAEAKRLLDEALLSRGARVTFICPLGMLTSYSLDGLKIQSISLRYYDGLKELIDSFDFTASMAAINHDTLVLSKDFSRDIKNKHLRLHRLTYPAATLNRVIKYKSKGYFVHDILRDICNKVYDHDRNIIDMEIVYVD